MSGRRDAAVNSIFGSKLWPASVVDWRGRGSLDFEDASIMVRDPYSDIVVDAAPFPTGNGVSGSC